MAASDRHELGFFLLRYVPDAVKEEFVNIGVVMVGGGTDAGYADVRFTRDWRRVLCLDPGADLEWLQALERDIRMRLMDGAGRADILYRLRGFVLQHDSAFGFARLCGSGACFGVGSFSEDVSGGRAIARRQASAQCAATDCGADEGCV